MKYHVPTMDEIKRIPLNGCKVVSTFSGGGGSCLGYRMAGFKVVYANEFVEEARKTYAANNPDTILDGRDIRTVTGESILQMTGLKKGEIDLFDGSPPCCAFSVSGVRTKGWNKVREYSDGKMQKIEDLFEEYIRLLRDLQPKVFVAENVKGLVLGAAVGFFKKYLREMKECGYRVEARLLNAKYLGVPQARERIIFVGVRNDLGKDPVFPKPMTPVLTLRDALEGVDNSGCDTEEMIERLKNSRQGAILRAIPKNPPRNISASNICDGSWFNLIRCSWEKPSPTTTTVGMNGAGIRHPSEDRAFTIPELKRITSIPDDFILTGTTKQQWERLARMVPPLMIRQIASTIYSEVLSDG